MIQKIRNHLKNIKGWKTQRKIVVIAVDDYGNVRIDSKAARMAMDKAGLKIYSRFDAYDTLETREDLEMLFEVLNAVKDQKGQAAVFTPFALPCNVDFEKMASENYTQYRYELLPETYAKLSDLQPNAYNGAWALWQEGIKNKWLQPEFHGREHFNLKVFQEKLTHKDSELRTALQHRSLTSISSSGYNSIGWTAAFSFWDPDNDTKAFSEILHSGLTSFEKVYGYSAKVFTPPAQQLPESIEFELATFGIQALDKPFSHAKHLGFGQYKKSVNTIGFNKKTALVELVRNVVFEPTDNRGFDWVAYSLQQVEAAFFWNKPAIISTHRVNFCGHIDTENRTLGLKALHQLLVKIASKWPDVEFMTARELSDLISETHD
ncbi:hypothetical protein [Flavobacterium sp.]|uniref:hypothetical protein n=1 Tax=Flavobacterium sp. TaxID=239 RepID=UPI002FDEBBC0